MKELTEKTIGEIVAEDYRTAAVFEDYQIDFCCNGHRSFSQACSDKDIDSQELLSKLEKVMQPINNDAIDFKSWPLDLLVDYIEKKHHRYVEEKIPVLKQYLEKINQVHGSTHPELLKIKELFNASAGELAAHMKKEEFILFPFIRNLVNTNRSGKPPVEPHFGKVENPINMLVQEHNNEGERFREISSLSNNYASPDDACNTYKVTYATLKEFEDDLHLHIHLENNILFPKAMEMENNLRNE
ncbi:MAG: iron-sulfur cluster repair di-iron protein [Cyclobacteriaceae bacterium]|nr:MAG: iron-sulfur cluster repair di-iron protein [Cyclobacteriaceae bacterium]